MRRVATSVGSLEKTAGFPPPSPPPLRLTETARLGRCPPFAARHSRSLLIRARAAEAPPPPAMPRINNYPQNTFGSGKLRRKWGSPAPFRPPLKTAPSALRERGRCALLRFSSSSRVGISAPLGRDYKSARDATSAHGRAWRGDSGGSHLPRPPECVCRDARAGRPVILRQTAEIATANGRRVARSSVGILQPIWLGSDREKRVPKGTSGEEKKKCTGKTGKRGSGRQPKNARAHIQQKTVRLRWQRRVTWSGALEASPPVGRISLCWSFCLFPVCISLVCILCRLPACEEKDEKAGVGGKWKGGQVGRLESDRV